MGQTNGNPSGDAVPVTTSAGSSVLVLDDDATIRDVVCRFLQKHGYRSLEASTVSEAAAVLQDASVIAVLLDVRLSGPGSGLDLLHQLRNEPALDTTPAIVMTAVVLTEAEKVVVEQHGGLLFYKPDGLSALIGCLRQITTRRQSHETSR